LHVDGDVEIRGASSSLNSEVVVEKQGILDVDGAISVRMFGALQYRDGTSANGQTIDNFGNAAGGHTGGRAIFANTASASNARIRNHGAGAFVSFGAAPAGATHFLDNSDAGTANITNKADGTVSTVVNGQTVFYGSSSASFATIENEGSASQSANPGRTEFRNNSRAGNATIHNRAVPTIGDLAGRTLFYDSSTADNSMINLFGGLSDDGRVEFHNTSSAGNARIIAHNIPTIAGRPNNGGKILFHDNSSAAQSQITMRQNSSASFLYFYNNSTAASAQIVTEDGAGQLAFFGSSTAASANISLGRGSVNSFYDTTTAANATFTMAHGAQLFFQNHSSAGQAHITAAGSSVYPISGAAVTFNSTSLINNTTITLGGATASLATGASASFINGAHAGTATITANGGVNGGGGGTISFSNSYGDSARIIANAGSTVDFFAQPTFNNGSTSLGSIEGAGKFVLRGSHLITGSRNLSTTVSGPITDNPNNSPFYSGGRLTKVGTGTLTLAGANNYSGVTTVNVGALRVTGSLAGAAVVNSGGTLGGTGTIGGGVTVNSGGVFAPGASAGTLTVGGLTMAPGGALYFELGSPASDRIVLTGNGNVTLDGTLNIALLDGFTPTLGQTFPLFEGAIGSVTGAFDAFNAPTFNGLTLNLVQIANSVTLVVGQSSLLSADFDADGDVDGADLTQWRADFGQNADSDADDDNDSDGADFLAWQRQVGSASIGPTSLGIPEPSAPLMVAMAVIGVAGRRRR
jgi:autotransporter-associated beta strand protein